MSSWYVQIHHIMLHHTCVRTAGIIIATAYTVSSERMRKKTRRVQPFGVVDGFRAMNPRRDRHNSTGPLSIGMSASLRWLRWMPSCTVDAHRMRTSARDARGAMLREQTYLPQPGSQLPACPVDAMAICQPQVYRDGNEGSRQNGENCTQQQDVTLQPFRAPSGDT